VSGLKGDLSKLRALERAIKKLPTKVSFKVAERSASVITDMARETFNAGQNAYGDVWKPGADGRTITLRKSGRLADDVRYMAVGTRLRAVLGPKYAVYQIGRRPIFPRNGATLPFAYIEKLKSEAESVIADEFARSAP
jgi:hypothetical protein